jgi:hypothetical protein
MPQLQGVNHESFTPLVRSTSDLKLLQAKLSEVIQDSFVQDAVRSKGRVVGTQAEVKRRTEICLKWFRVMRGDLGYSTERALDFLSLALRKELDGESWEPPAQGAAWGPDAIKPKD